MSERRASCRCGALVAVARGEPARVSVCHCDACRRRTGSAFSYNSTWAEDQVEWRGPARSFRRTNEEGYWAEYQFCPDCGSTLVYRIERRPGMVSIPVGAFADPAFPEPAFSVFDDRRHPWCAFQTREPMERW